MMTDLTLSDTHDILFENGDFPLQPDDIEAIAQRLKIRLKTFLKEWFLDLNIGIPYFEKVLIKNPNPALVRGIFSRVILETAGVKAFTSLTFALDTETRGLSLEFEATTETGETFTFNEVLI